MSLISISEENTLSCSRLEHDTQVNSRVTIQCFMILVWIERHHTFSLKWLDVYSLLCCRWKIAKQKKNANRTQTRHIQPCNIPLDSLCFLQWKHSWFHSYTHYSPILCLIKVNLEQVIPLRPTSMLTSRQSHKQMFAGSAWNNTNILTQISKISYSN